MNVVLENQYLSISIKKKGAELNQVFSKETKLEYMWSGDPAFWGKTSPVLFPIVGTLKEDTFIYNNRKYNISRHGFARDLEFQIQDQNKDSVVFLLTSNSLTLEKYPFLFELRLIYRLEKNSIQVVYDVKNIGDSEMYFSIGAHPAFAVPLLNDESFEDYYLEFNKTENSDRWPINKAGLIEEKPIPLINNTNRIDLTRTLFLNDAVVLKHLRSNSVSIKSAKTSHGLDFLFDGFPFLGIWSAKNANFVCIEPWCGIADSVEHNQQFITKEGIERIIPQETWSRVWQVTFY